jgi:hypothetical protein
VQWGEKQLNSTLAHDLPNLLQLCAMDPTCLGPWQLRTCSTAVHSKACGLTQPPWSALPRWSERKVTTLHGVAAALMSFLDCHDSRRRCFNWSKPAPLLAMTTDRAHPEHLAFYATDNASLYDKRLPDTLSCAGMRASLQFWQAIAPYTNATRTCGAANADFQGGRCLMTINSCVKRCEPFVLHDLNLWHSKHCLLRQL